MKDGASGCGPCPWSSSRKVEPMKQAYQILRSRVTCAYRRNAPNSEWLGQQNNMHLLTNMHL